MRIEPLRLLVILGISAQFIPARANVLTYHNDNARTGQNLLETILTPANVNSSQFGKLFTMAVDGKVDGQPLYVQRVTFPNKVVHSVVYVVTEHDSVYAFDAATPGPPLWQVSLLQGNETPSDSRNCGQVTPEIGITATPVIDLSVGPNGTMYVVAMSKNTTSYFQRIHALNLATGAEQFSGPVNIQATYPGTGDGSTGGTVVFDPKQYKSRPGLLLVNGTVYTSWGSHCDIRPYTGWTIAYDARTLAQTSVFNFAPNGNEAAIWASGAGPAADGFGNLYFQTANGTFDTALTPQGFPAKGDYGNSFVKLANANGKLNVLDYWTMYNSDSESSVDEDLGSGGVMLLPEQFDSFGQIRRLAVGAGKDRNVYVVDRDNMGKYDPTNNSNIYQSLPAGLSGPEFAMPGLLQWLGLLWGSWRYDPSLPLDRGAALADSFVDDGPHLPLPRNHAFHFRVGLAQRHPVGGG